MLRETPEAGWWALSWSSRAAKTLHQELELLIDLRLGSFHGDEAVDQAEAIGFDDPFEVGNLRIDRGDILGKLGIFVD